MLSFKGRHTTDYFARGKKSETGSETRFSTQVTNTHHKLELKWNLQFNARDTKSIQQALGHVTLKELI